MKIGVSSYSFAKYKRETNCSYFTICDLAKQMGFDGIEFTELEPETIDLATEIKDYCTKIELPVTAYCVGANLNKICGKKEIQKVKKHIDIAEALGAPVLRHDVCHFLPPFCSYKKAIERMTPRIREITEYAQKKGIMTCTENHGIFFQAPNRVQELIESVQSPNYRWLCDIGNFLCVDADPIESVKIASDYAIHVHVKDFLLSDKMKEGYFPTSHRNFLCGTVVGKGIVPVKECLAVLKEKGYDGYFDIEFEGKEDTLQALKESLVFLR